MNIQEPDKFEQFMSSVQQTGDGIEENLQWLVRNIETIAIASAVPILVLAATLVLAVRWWRPRPRRNPSVSGMRHARR